MKKRRPPSSVEDRHQAALKFTRRYNDEWLIEPYGRARADLVQFCCRFLHLAHLATMVATSDNGRPVETGSSMPGKRARSADGSGAFSLNNAAR